MKLFISVKCESEPGPEMTVQQKRKKDKKKVISNRTREMCLLYPKLKVSDVPESRNRKPE